LIKSFEGNTPVLHPTAFVSEMAYIVGDVEIGEGSSIWPGTVIRGDMGKVKIGKFSNVQDNSVVHGDADVVIGDNVVIGHRVMCHAAEIGDRVLVGNGASLNDGVKVGENSIIGSGYI
jgi:carbonic anhydrase/acetyltransferase-like protein (isoleucine patch superfamily)